ncbi:MAG: HEPN domain-containing protein [Firmicutes bacterium]|nr:HEPN domain-containing protein [Bacillota bacterium]
MTDFTNVNAQLREIASYNNSTPCTSLTDHLPKLCVIIVVTEFEKCIKNAIENFLSKPKSGMVGLIETLEATSRKDIDFIYGRFFPVAKRGTIYSCARDFFKLMGGRFSKISETTSFGRFSKNQETLYTRELSKVRLSPTNRIDIENELNIVRVTNFDEAQDLFLELKNLRNDVAHEYILDGSYTVDKVIEKYHRAKLFVGALEKTFKFYTLP